MVGGVWYRLMPIILLVAITLPGCKSSHKSYYLRPLPSLIDYQGTQNDIDLRVKKLNEHDCQSILGKSSNRLFKKFRKRRPIQPLQISITNNTNKLISIKPSDISLPQVPYKKVANRLSNNSLIQVFGAFLSSLFIGGFLAVGSFLALSATGLLLFVTGSLGLTIPAAIIGIPAAAAFPLFLIIGTPVISTMRGVKTVQANHAITKNIKQYALKVHTIISPHETVDMLIFVDKFAYRPSFSIKITNPQNAQKQISFNVHIPSLDNFIER